MRYALYAILTLLIASCTTSKETAIHSDNKLMTQELIEQVRAAHAPDKRTAIFKVNLEDNILTGETNLPEAKQELMALLNQNSISVLDSLVLLPEEALDGKVQAVVSISVANLRSEPKHWAELATQATMGTPLKVWKKERGWYLVQTPDKYIAWVDAGGVTLMDSNSFEKWQKEDKLIYTQPFGLAYSIPDIKGATVTDLVYGDIISLQTKQNGFWEVALPDNRKAFVLESEAIQYKEWVNSLNLTEQNLVEASKQLMGMPYLWGGTSFKGVDCSGFTKTVFFMNGLVLPRDASQQVNTGTLVDTTEGWDKLVPGDLLFFGSPAQNGKKERVVHVGMWLGNDEFIHAAGRVKVSSLNPNAENYDAFEHNRFLRAKRVVQDSSLLRLQEHPLFESN